MDVLTVVCTVAAGASSWSVVQRRRRSLRRRALSVRLAALDGGLPMRVDHLSTRLQALVIGARSTRRVLETPLARVLATSSAPWSVGGSLRDYDLALTEARRTLWDWMCGFRHLDAADISVLRELELDPRPLRSLMYQPGLLERGHAFEGTFSSAPDVDGVIEGILGALERLRHFEVALLCHRSDPYR